MPLATLRNVLAPALADRYALAGMVVLGWEDACAYVAAAEDERAPVILQAGPACRAHTPLPVLGAMFRALGERASVPVVAHLDHGRTPEECDAAIDAGFTSVMIDGSRLPLAENVALTAEVVRRAARAGVSVEGEIGFVGYDAGEASRGTVPEEARRFAEGTGVDAMAIAVGNVHLQREAGTRIDAARLRAIEGVTRVPLVLHGGSGIDPATRRALATTTQVCKFNVGTEVRVAFGRALRRVLAAQPEAFDRIAILTAAMPEVRAAARAVLASVGSSGRAAAPRAPAHGAP